MLDCKIKVYSRLTRDIFLLWEVCKVSWCISKGDFQFQCHKFQIHKGNLSKISVFEVSVDEIWRLQTVRDWISSMRHCDKRCTWEEKVITTQWYSIFNSNEVRTRFLLLSIIQDASTPDLVTFFPNSGWFLHTDTPRKIFPSPRSGKNPYRRRRRRLAPDLFEPLLDIATIFMRQAFVVLWG